LEPPLSTGIMRGSNEMALQAGTRLGPYEVLSLIGAGGMGEVYERLSDRTGVRHSAITTLWTWTKRSGKKRDYEAPPPQVIQMTRSGA
jgi:hypothetical protein